MSMLRRRPSARRPSPSFRNPTWKITFLAGLRFKERKSRWLIFHSVFFRAVSKTQTPRKINTRRDRRRKKHRNCVERKVLLRISLACLASMSENVCNSRVSSPGSSIDTREILKLAGNRENGCFGSRTKHNVPVEIENSFCWIFKGSSSSFRTRLSSKRKSKLKDRGNVNFFSFVSRC